MRMRLIFLACVVSLVGATDLPAVVIDFAGGTVTLQDLSTHPTTETSLYSDAVSYTEGAMVFEFIGTLGIIGNYYNPSQCPISEAVMHVHPIPGSSIRIRRADNQPFDLNYFDITSNTINGGYAATGTENTIATASNGTWVKLPSADWGIACLSDGSPGDGVVSFLFPPSFDDVLYVDVTTTNAYCFGLDNFYVDEEPPLAGVPMMSPYGIGVFALGVALLALLKLRSAAA